MDPRSSSPGFQFLVWIINQFGEETLYQFIKKAYLISPSWSTAYGLFTKKQTHAAFSYLTSLAYHWIEENNTDFQIMNFDFRPSVSNRVCRRLLQSSARLGNCNTICKIFTSQREFKS